MGSYIEGAAESARSKSVTLPSLSNMKSVGEKIAMLRCRTFERRF